MPKLKILFYLYLCVCVQVLGAGNRGQLKVSDSLGAGVIDGLEWMLRTELWSSIRTGKFLALTSCAIPPAPSLTLMPL